MSCSDSWCLKLVREISNNNISNSNNYNYNYIIIIIINNYNISNSNNSSNNWKERRPKKELVLGVTREIYLL